MYKVMRSFICRGCSNPVISTGHTSVDIGASANLEVVDKLLRVKTGKLYSSCVRSTDVRSETYTEVRPGLSEKTRSPAIAEGPRDAGVPVEIW